MRHLAPTLSTLVLTGLAVAPLTAATIKDDSAGLTLGIKGLLQTRLSLFAKGTYSETTAGGYPAGGAGSPAWYQGGDPVYYPLASTTAQLAAGSLGAAVPYYSNSNATLASLWPPAVAAAWRSTAPTVAPVYTRNGAAYDIYRGQPGEPESARFDIRRGRLAFDATYGDGWKGMVILNFDNIDATGANVNRGVTLYRATAGKSFKTGDFTHELSAGLDAPYSLDYALTGTAYALPYRSPTHALVDNGFRGAGLFYLFNAPIGNLGASFMNNSNASTPGASSNGVLSEGAKGNLATLRIELSPSKAMKPKSLRESWIGADGLHLQLGYDLEKEWGKQITYAAPQNYVIPYAGGTQTWPVAALNPAAPYFCAWYDQQALIHGPDLVLHWNSLTTVAAYKYRITRWQIRTDAGGALVDPNDLHSDAASLTAAYAVPVGGVVLEPALRLSRLDADRHRDEYSNYGRGFDYGAATGSFTPSPWASNRNDTNGSGRQFEAGVNCYFKENANKLQLAYIHWQAEQGIGRAQVVVLQHQLAF